MPAPDRGRPAHTFRPTRNYRVTSAAVAPHEFQEGDIVRWVRISAAGDRHLFRGGPAAGRMAGLCQWLAAADVEEAS